MIKLVGVSDCKDSDKDEFLDALRKQNGLTDVSSLIEIIDVIEVKELLYCFYSF